MMTFQQLMVRFPDEDSCRQFLFDRRWPNGVRCPRCDKSQTVYPLKAFPWRWECSNPECRSGNAYRFSLLVGTIFENTKHPLATWFKILYTMLQSKKGVSSRQIRRMFFGETSSLHTAWYMCHRLRAAMRDPEFKQLLGIVEVDETYIGGSDTNRHRNKKTHKPGTFGKIPVIGAISRKGNVVCKMIENTDTATLDSFVRTAVSRRVDLVATDEHSGYRLLGLHREQFGYPHKIIRHSGGEYVRGLVHTNSIESFWSLLKRGIIGTYHNVSKKYLPLYLAEFQFRFNNRNEADIFDKAIGGC